MHIVDIMSSQRIYQIITKIKIYIFHDTYVQFSAFSFDINKSAKKQSSFTDEKPTDICNLRL